MPDVQLIAWPYHAGLRDVGMGLGALGRSHAIDGAPRRARGRRLPRDRRDDPARRRGAARGRADLRARPPARAPGRRGVRPERVPARARRQLLQLPRAPSPAPGARGAVWLDAHADFDTPEDNLSGFTDVMGLAILTGSGWRALRETIPGFAPLAEADVVLAGVRDLEPYQRERLAASAVRTVPGAVDGAALADALDRVARVGHADLPPRRPRRARRRGRPREPVRRARRAVGRRRARRRRRRVRPLRRRPPRRSRRTTRARTPTARWRRSRGASRAGSPSA